MSRIQSQSGIPYLGVAPASWQIVRNKNLFNHSRKIVGSKSKTSQLLSLTTQGIRKKDIRSTEGKLPSTFDTYQLVRESQLVLCLFDLDQSAVFAGRSPHDGMISPAYTVLSCNAQIRPEFADYWFAYIFMGRKYAYFAKNIRHTMTWDDFSQMFTLVPTLDEQDRIVSFLDAETAKIDHLIAKQRTLIQLLDEHSKSATYQILEKSVYGAKRLRLKWLLSKMRRPVLEGSEIVTAYDDGEVTLRSNRRLDGYWMSSDDSSYQGVKQGDFVFHGLDGYRGAVGLSDSDGKMTPACHVCSVSKTIRPDFLVLYLRFLGDSGYLKSQSMTVRGDSMDFRNWQKVTALSVPVPSLTEQKEAVDQLAELKSREGAILASSTRLINLLQERRSALITAAVTGQIEF
ncbi:hypothetical protein DAD186_17720 [Dermabacter vaginalis]|uniref:Restriction endonuclease subunit S n=1 Tax=Dermabacter vaginalis TaxID=1630135 RepID=A0A1B0ZKD2_9MICO|nr:restriction endonuclease subunit S [Dermabacter vaginalis]ANP28322.1 hypothetical protein DAD186_17720 [Dermabacter vaginalis]